MSYALADEEAAFESITITYCENVGEAKPDIAGLGVLISFAGQALLSLFLAAWIVILSKKGHLHLHHHPEGSDEHERRKKRIEFLSDVVNIGNDLQVLLGIALMITAWTKRKELGLYHLRLVFDTVSFVGCWRQANVSFSVNSVSSIAVLVCLAFCQKMLNRSTSRLSSRYLTIYGFGVFFIALAITFVIRLANWQEGDKLGECYNTAGASSRFASHPGSDQAYVLVTALWLLIGVGMAVFGGPKLLMVVLVFAMLEYPVHLYFMIAIRHANQPLLEGTEDEDKWDFGQTTAMLLLGLAYLEFFVKAVKYRKWTVQWKKNNENLIPLSATKFQGASP
ncbi:hypothetical protein PG993_008305 [Apiospora rasikravindrae]|uniref:Uncharacterized protein n=1 Tax=Apiospora rasikravindrae TaxID=990691 RepID=A0ABR1SZZ0_9PEZI